MDQKRISSYRLSKEYEDGVNEFTRVDVINGEKTRSTKKNHIPLFKVFLYKCECRCFERHSICNRIYKNYRCWIYHEEEKYEYTNSSRYTGDRSIDFEKDMYESDHVEEFVNVQQ